MGDVLAIVSRAVFERDAPRAGLGDVLPLDVYRSKNKALAPLSEGGSLFLVTVRPPDERLWLVAILESPRAADECWTSRTNVTAVTDVTPIVGQIRFENGVGIAAKPGTLGMVLQTPRRLTANDARLFRSAASGHRPPKATASVVHASREGAPPKKTKKEAAPPQPQPTLKADSTLAVAAARLAASELLAALDAVLEAWRAHPSRECAEFIEALGTRIDQSLPAIAGDGAALQGAWLALATRRNPADVGRLLARLEDATIESLAKRFAILGTFGPDPRISAPILDAAVRFTSFGALPMYTAAFAAAERMRDGRVIAHLAGQLRAPDSPYRRPEERFQKLAGKVAKLQASLAPPPAPTANDESLLAGMRATLRALAKTSPLDEAALLATALPSDRDETLGQALVDAVLAAPDDDAPRAVYADWLLDAGDPRGEHLALELKAASGKRLEPAEARRLRELEKEYASLWIRPLDAIVKPDSIRFKRGFLDACRVEIKASQQKKELVGHPLWATVREMDCDDQDLLTHPILQSLKVATLDGNGLSTLAARDAPVPLEKVIGPLASILRVRTGAVTHNKGGWMGALEVGALTSLRTLSLRPAWNAQSPKVLGWLVASKLARQLEVLDFASMSFGLLPAPWLDAGTDLPGLRRLVFRQTNDNPNMTGLGKLEILAFEREKKEWRAVVQVNALDDPTLLAKTRATLAGFPRKDARRVRLEYIGTGSGARPAKAHAFVAVLSKAFADVEVATATRSTPLGV